MGENRNPFFDLLIPVSVLFVVTVLWYALVPSPSQPGWFQVHAWKLLLAQVAAIIVLGLASMALDRIRTLRLQKQAGTMRPGEASRTNAAPTSDDGAN